MAVTDSFMGLTTTQTAPAGPEHGSVEWAEMWLKESGVVSRRTSLKRLSAKKIAELIERLVRAECERDEHECEDRYDRYDW